MRGRLLGLRGVAGRVKIASCVFKLADVIYSPWISVSLLENLGFLGPSHVLRFLIHNLNHQI